MTAMFLGRGQMGSQILERLHVSFGTSHSARREAYGILDVKIAEGLVALLARELDR